MTTVRTHARMIAEVEGFEITVTRADGTPVDVTGNGLLNKAWTYERKMKHGASVSDFRERFANTYPGFTCKVLNEDGSVAEGQTHLSTMRQTYEEE